MDEFDDFDFDDDVLDENDLVELVHHANTSQAGATIAGSHHVRAGEGSAGGVSGGARLTVKLTTSHDPYGSVVGGRIRPDKDAYQHNQDQDRQRFIHRGSKHQVGPGADQNSKDGDDTVEFTSGFMADHLFGPSQNMRRIMPIPVSISTIAQAVDEAVESPDVDIDLDSDLLDSAAGVSMSDLDPDTPTVNAAEPVQAVVDTVSLPFRYQRIDPVMKEELADSGRNQTGDIGLLQLHTEIAALRAKAAAAEQASQARLGEVLILRTKLDESVRQADDRASRLEQQLVQARAQHQADIDGLRAEREKMAVDNRFLEHEMAESSRVRRPGNGMSSPARPAPSRSGHGGHNAAPPARVTAKPVGAPVLADGFSDQDGLSRLQPRQKRKRAETGVARLAGTAAVAPPIGSSVQLERHVADLGLDDHTPVSMVLPSFDAPMSQLHTPGPTDGDMTVEPDERFDFLRQMFALHTADGSRPMEQLMALPPPPAGSSSSLGSAVVDGLPRTGGLAVLASRLCSRILQLWAAVLDLNDLRSVSAFVALLGLGLGGAVLSSVDVTTLVCCVVQTVDLALDPTGPRPASDEPADAGCLDGSVGGTEPTLPMLSIPDVLGLVEIVAGLPENQFVEPNPETGTTSQMVNRLIWSAIPTRLVHSILDRNQSVNRQIGMLSLLRLSVSPDSFGPITGEDDGPAGSEEVGMQEAAELAIVTRLFTFLSDHSFDPTVRSARLCFDALQTLFAIAATDRGIGRIVDVSGSFSILVSFLAGRVDLMYQTSWAPRPAILPLYPRSQTSTPPPTGHLQPGRATVKSTIRQINLATRLLYVVVTHGQLSQSDIRARLMGQDEGDGSQSGAEYSHLVGLSRLAFAETVWIKAGLETETAEAAHHLLDDYLSPDEGDKLLAVFSGPVAE